MAADLSFLWREFEKMTAAWGIQDEADVERIDALWIAMDLDETIHEVGDLHGVVRLLGRMARQEV